jgi:2-polyprenyl-6-methoxyphenol hydroxylase-like FAD-dependent oxidoreductase
VQKILVIGAGIAGPAACYWLRKHGFSPTLVEKSLHLRKGGQALDIRGVAIGLVKQMGIYERLCHKRTRVECGRYVDAHGNTLAEEKGEKFWFRQGEDVEIARGDLVELLMSTINDVPCRFNQSIVDIKQHDDTVEVFFKDGDTEHFDLVIGADGIHSATRRMVFNQTQYQLINLGSYISTFSIPNYLNLSHTEVLYESNQKLASITSDEDPKKARAAFMFRPHHDLINPRDENEQKQFLMTTFADFGWEIPKVLELMMASDDFYFDAATQVKMDSWTQGRVALLGDAGYCASPLSGQGNNLALVGAYILAGELKTANGDFRQAFSRYNELLHPFIEVNQSLGAWASQFFLATGELSSQVIDERMNMVLEKVQTVANAITLPKYA